ncbi:TetR/AcrR family transcriptional regulator [Spirochaeta isovalerica]|uniref:AcrR family transcriptional regulator n=1 Tax=Spirochaeta isovalerica TaxID=150 RepID=A0A841RBT8_9SPIO|nr:TetR/AcrR family transcriptional regulator [Spirochaeta isovalerica]MBB6481403.1 AcrR family transcriptional regulator [Spirochaeta isovalerica]
MPKETFRKLSAQKRQRVFDAAISEFCRVPLEDVSIKNIVEKAGIARGSFYQYFWGKEDLFLYLLCSLRANLEEDLAGGESIYQFIYSLAEKEIREIKERSDAIPVKAQLLRQIAASPSAINIFERDITEKLRNDDRFQNMIKESGLASIEECKMSAMIELLTQSLRRAVIQVISSNRTADEALLILHHKLQILKKGING